MRRRAVTALDVALLVGLAAGGAALLLRGNGHGAARAEIWTPSGTESLPLARPGARSVEGPLGATEVRVAEGAVRVAASPCPLQSCVRAGPIRRPGQVLACLPNRVLVRVVGAAPDPADVDAVGR